MVKAATFYSFNTILETEPIIVLNAFMAELREDSFKITSIDSDKEQKAIGEVLNKMASYSCYFAEMQEKSKMYKRKLKSSVKEKELIDNIALANPYASA